jgi:iron complex outermembrane receptor protein
MGRVAAVICMMGLGLASVRAEPPDKATLEKARAHFQQGEAYLMAKAYDLAVKEYEAAYQLVPKPDILFNIGLAYEALGDPKQALFAYQRYLSTAPETAVKRAEATARVVGLERAIKEQEEKAAKDKADADARARRARDAAEAIAAGRAHLGRGAFAEAIAAYRKAYDLAGNVELLYEIAEAYRQQGDEAQALVEYERYRKEAPAGAHVAEAVSHITTIQQTMEERARTEQRVAQLHASAS